jgi:1-acyl-sn-glycerol-3-phosphate acyltransferase
MPNDDRYLPPDKKPLLYLLTGAVVRFGLRIFFQKIELRHAGNIPPRGPVLFVANHPNSVMDALLLGAVAKRKVNYLAHAGLFRWKPMAWFLTNCGVIPVHRRSDDPEKMDQNVNAFVACYERLEAGETIGIFPEGTSDMLRKVKKVKTGAARILLETEARNGYDLGVVLLPVGLHFFSRSRFRSRVLINFGEPVPLVKFFTKYADDPVEGVRALTDEIQARLEALTVNIREDELDRFVREIEFLYRDELKSADGSKSTIEEFVITQKIAECVQYYQDHRPELVAEMRERITEYRRKLDRLRLRDAVLRESQSKATITRDMLRVAGIGLLGMPLALYGAMNNLIPYLISEGCARMYLHERTKILTALLIGGGLAFLFFYAAQIAAAAKFTSPLWATLYGISLPLSGFFALAYVQRMRKYRQRVSFSFLLFTNKHLVIKMRRQRKALIAAMNQVRDEYLSLLANRRAGALQTSPT